MNNPHKYTQFPDRRVEGKNIIEQLHLVQFRILQIFDCICAKHDIDYWLDYGTLLGAIRHKGFIPWDTDIDIGMIRPDYDLFIQNGINELPFDIFFQNKDSDPYYSKFSHIIEARLRDKYSNWTSIVEKYKVVDWHNGIHVDIFVYDLDPRFDNVITNNYERILSNGNIHLRFDEIGCLYTALFEGYEFPIPIGFDSYLKRCYGNYWELPPEEERNKIPNVDIYNACNHKEILFREHSGLNKKMVIFNKSAITSYNFQKHNNEY